MSENTTTLCPTCTSSIFCNTWGQFKCTAKERYITGYKTMTVCGDYKKRPKHWKESPCRCEDCLKNDLLADELEDVE